MYLISLHVYLGRLIIRGLFASKGGGGLFSGGGEGGLFSGGLFLFIFIFFAAVRERGGAYCVVPENIHTPHGRFFGLSPHPPGISSLALYFPLKILAFETPSPSEFLLTVLGVSMDIFCNCALSEFYRK